MVPCENANKTLQGIKTTNINDNKYDSAISENANKTLQGIKTCCTTLGKDMS